MANVISAKFVTSRVLRLKRWRSFWSCWGRRGKKRKGIEAHRVKYPTPSQATDALTGEEEQNGKQKRTKRKKQGTGYSCFT